MLRLTLLAGGDIVVPPNSIKSFSISVNVVLTYNDLTTETLSYTTYEEMNLTILNPI